MEDVTGNVIAAIVVNYGSIAMIEENFAELSGLPDCQVIIVDNFSSTDEQERVREATRRHGWTAVLSERNLGFGGGVNLGVRRARDLNPDAYLLINPDAIIDVATVRALHDHVREQPADLVAPRIVRPDGRDWSLGFAINMRTGRMRRRPGLRNLQPDELPWLTGACLAVSRNLADRVGEMPTPYFLYWEDVDFSLTVQAAGGSLVVREDLIATHSEGGTQRAPEQTRRLSDRYYFYNCRNRLLYASMHLSRRQVASWIVHTPRQSLLILLRGGRRQLVQSPRPAAAALAGSVAGIGIAAWRMMGPRSGQSNHADHGSLLTVH